MPSERQPRLRRQGDHWWLEGDLTFATVSGLLEESRHQLSGCDTTLRIHFDGVGRADSAALALLIEWQRMAQACGLGIRYLGLPGSLLALIELSGLEQIFVLG